MSDAERRYKVLRDAPADDVPVWGNKPRPKVRRPYAVQVWWRPWWKMGRGRPHWWTVRRYARLRDANQGFDAICAGWLGRGRDVRLVVEVPR